MVNDIDKSDTTWTYPEWSTFHRFRKSAEGDWYIFEWWETGEGWHPEDPFEYRDLRDFLQQFCAQTIELQRIKAEIAAEGR
jgi:hypothetical protein